MIHAIRHISLKEFCSSIGKYTDGCLRDERSHEREGIVLLLLNHLPGSSQICVLVLADLFFCSSVMYVSRLSNV